MINYFEYVPSVFCSKDYFDRLYAEVKDKCIPYSVTIKNQSYDAHRISCMFGDPEMFDYQREMYVYAWELAPTIQEIKRTIEEKTRIPYDYCLVHIYRDGSDYIGYHNDKEALTTTVASVSFGATRKFRFRKFSTTKGFDHEFELKNGDMVIMWGARKDLPGCQTIYKHSVPIQKRIKEPRINLTFRQI